MTVNQNRELLDAVQNALADWHTRVIVATIRKGNFRIYQPSSLYGLTPQMVQIRPENVIHRRFLVQFHMRESHLMLWVNHGCCGLDFETYKIGFEFDNNTPRQSLSVKVHVF